MMPLLALLALPTAFMSAHTAPWRSVARCRSHAALVVLDSDEQLDLAATRVHSLAAAFSPAHWQAAVEYTEAIISEGPAARESLLNHRVLLFDDVQACLTLRRAMARLLTLVAERRAERRLVRIVSGMEARIEQAVVEVRTLSGEFGASHARAAVEWTNRVVAADALAVLPREAMPEALLEQTTVLFDSCSLTGDGAEPVACQELREALGDLIAMCERRALAAAAARAPTLAADAAEAGRLAQKMKTKPVVVWSKGDGMPPRLAEWGTNRPAPHPATPMHKTSLLRQGWPIATQCQSLASLR
jgi:hypothetical protein